MFFSLARMNFDIFLKDCWQFWIWLCIASWVTFLEISVNQVFDSFYWIPRPSVKLKTEICFFLLHLKHFYEFDHQNWCEFIQIQNKQMLHEGVISPWLVLNLSQSGVSCTDERGLAEWQARAEII